MLLAVLTRGRGRWIDRHHPTSSSAAAAPSTAATPAASAAHHGVDVVHVDNAAAHLLLVLSPLLLRVRAQRARPE